MMEQWMNEGIKAARAGQRKEAARWFYRVAKQDPNNQTAWLYFSDMQDDVNKQREILVWLSNRFPGNPEVQRRLQRLDQVGQPRMQRPPQAAFEARRPSAPAPGSGTANQPGRKSPITPPGKKKIGTPAILAITAVLGISCVAVFAVTYFLWKQFSTGPGDTPAEVALPGLLENVTDSMSTPQECRIAFVSDRDGYDNLYTMDDEGNDVRQLTSFNESNSKWFLWSPNGKQIAVISHQSEDYEMYVMNADGSNLQLLTSFTNSGFAHIAWSPNSKQIAFDSDHTGYDGLYVINADGSNLRQLASSDANSSNYQQWSPDWSPDSSQIAFVDYEYRKTYVIKANGSNLRVLTSAAGGGGPDWSPDGSQIALFAESEQTGKVELYVIDTDGRNPRQLTFSEKDNNASYPVWSSNGEKIAYFLNTSQSNNLFVIDANGRNLRQLTFGDKIQCEYFRDEIEWSPNGTRIIYKAVSANNYVFDANSGDMKPFPKLLFPSWSPEGTRLIGDTAGHIFIFDADGNNSHQLTFDGHSFSPTWSPGCKK